MAEIRQEQTSVLFRRRPFMVKASVILDSGRTVEAVGTSLLSRGRASDEALERARQLAEQTDFGIEIQYARTHSASANILGDIIEHEGGLARNLFRNAWHVGPSLSLFGYKIEIYASRGGNRVQVRGKSLFNLRRATENAVKKAENQLETM